MALPSLFPHIPAGYCDEAESIPAFWLTTPEEVYHFLRTRIHLGTVETLAVSPGGRPVQSVSYGRPRAPGGTTTFSGTLGTRGQNIAYYRGTDAAKTVFVSMAAIHGGELDTIVGALNLLAVFETGHDLSGQAWPALVALRDQVDRIVIVPLLNPDGRARFPVRMEPYRGGAPDSFFIHEYLNTGGYKDGSLIGWPAVKEFIPMDFSQFGFPGGYPNDAGVNLMHDDFMGQPQPETRAMLDLCAREKPDLILNMHTGVAKDDYYMEIHRPFCEPRGQPVFDAFYRHVKTRLTLEGLQGSPDPAVSANPARVSSFAYNLNTALNLHSGGLCVTIESPCHGYSGTNRAGQPAIHSPETLLRTQLLAYEESLAFLAKTGGRVGWDAGLQP